MKIINQKQFAGPMNLGKPSFVDELFLKSLPDGKAHEPRLNPIAYQHALDNIAIIARTDLKGNIDYANDLFCDISGYKRNELIGSNHRILNSGHHSKSFFSNLWKVISDGRIWRGEICNRAKDGTLYWVDTTITPQFDLKGRISGYVGLRLDISARKRAEALAADARAQLKDIIEALPSGIIAYDKNGEIIFFNDAFKGFYDKIVPGIEIGRRRQDFVTRANQDVLLSATGLPIDKIDPRACLEPYMQHLPGDRWMQVRNCKSASGTLISIQTDVTDLKRIERQVTEQGRRDALTGAFNRYALFERLVVCCEKPNEPATVVLIDLDHFKAINDGLGHDAGDTLLHHVAQVLQSALRQADMLARFGGDEFAILLPDAHTAADVERVIDTVQAALATPVQIGQHSITPSASMGIARFPRDGDTPKKLMKSADLALYQCKHSARGTYKIYNRRMHRERVRRQLLTDSLRQTLARNGFAVVLQPQITMSNGRHMGFEALVRWKLGRRWIPPEELISIAEEAGLVTQLSRQLIDKALAMMAGIKSSGMEPGILGINVVAAQLHDPNFVEELKGMVRKHGFDPSEVEVEVTENVILDRSAEKLEPVLRELHSEGFSIALDDFGMGYASLTHLKSFPLNRLKIDRSFISGIMEDKDDYVIVRTIIALAHNLGLKVVAEGIETPEQLKELSNLGCDVAQGYLIGRPMDELGTLDYLEADVMKCNIG